MRNGPQEVNWTTVAGLAILIVLAGILITPANYAEYFLKEPGFVLAGCLATLVSLLPSLWVIRKLDRRPYGWGLYAAVVLFVVAIAPLVSEVTWAIINRGIRYWQIVGFTEEFAKILPLVVLLIAAPAMVRTVRDGLVIGALAGLGFAIIEFGVGFALDNFPERGWFDLAVSLPARWALGTQLHVIWGATTGAAIGYWREDPSSRKRLWIMIFVIAVVIITHGAQDFLGKYIGPLSIGAVGGFLLSAGLPETLFYEGGPLFVMLLVAGAVINAIVINIVVLPILWHLAWHNRTEQRHREL